MLNAYIIMKCMPRNSSCKFWEMIVKEQVELIILLENVINEEQVCSGLNKKKFWKKYFPKLF
jgi:hypothetical protein